MDMPGMPPPTVMVAHKDFPRVSPQEQAERDARRRRLLKDEQASALQNGEPDPNLDAEVRNAHSAKPIPLIKQRVSSSMIDKE